MILLRLWLLKRALGLADILDGLAMLFTGRGPGAALKVAKAVARERHRRR